MKKKKNIIFLVLLLLLTLVGTTYAYFTYSESFDNKFNIKDFDVVIEENFDPTARDVVTKEVFVVNKEDVPAIVRLSYNENVDFDYENTYRDLFSNLDSDYVTKNWTQEFYDDWYFYEGWYYYTKVLTAGESVQILESLERNSCMELYELDFNIEAVQATSDAVLELWGKNVTINENGTLVWEFMR